MAARKPSILVVCTSDFSGGAARAAFRIQKSVLSLGADSRMFVKNKISDDDAVIPLIDYLPENKIYKGVDWIRNKLKNKFQHHRWNKYPDRKDVFMSDLRSVPIHGAFQKINPDILHLHWINLRFLDLKELRKAGKPVVWTLHDCWPFTGICHYFYDCSKYKENCGNCPFLHSDSNSDLSRKVWEKKKKLYAGLNLHIVAPSRWLAESARQSSLFSAFPVHVIPNPIDTELYMPDDRQHACETLGLDAGKTYLLYGAMNALKDKNKGFDKLNEALTLYFEKYDCKDLVLLIVGADQPIYGLQTGIPVHYLGTIVEELRMVAVYRAASLMVVPSLSENLSNAIMESLSCGTPVVAFDIGGNGDMIDHQQNGYLAKAFDTEDLAQGIRWVAENNANGKLSESARKKVMDNYSMKQVAQQYLSLYNSITSVS